MRWNMTPHEVLRYLGFVVADLFGDFALAIRHGRPVFWFLAFVPPLYVRFMARNLLLAVGEFILTHLWRIMVSLWIVAFIPWFISFRW